ncbi:type-1 angiotensin II receptor-associated protein [Anolis carolinensis]|uniref:type-1 angiotensin II receptor-associated protein n=1 Tax=Anolis carolinensis TaxID=28377 RepID=UPI002F2B5E41
MEVPAVNLKAIILVHWLLTIWGCLEAWLPPSYAWSNFSVLALGVWAVAQRDSLDAILMFLWGLLLTVLTDIVHFGLFYPRGPKAPSDTMRFSNGMAVFSLLLKPLSCFFAHQMHRQRGGEEPFRLGWLGVCQERSAYQPIDGADTRPAPFPDATLSSGKGSPAQPY